MKLLFCILLITNLVFAQSKDPDQILKNVVDNFSRVQDYTVSVNIRVDVEFIKVPETKAKIYFKQPDKVHLESDGFAMLPKSGMEFSPSALINKEHTAIYEKDVMLNGINTSLVKVIPLGDQGDVILSSIWVDQAKQVIMKVESTTKTNGTFTIDFSYDKDFTYPLPKEIIFSFNVDKMNIPATISGETTTENPKKKKGRSDSVTKGKVIVKYNNYEVNKGLSDSIFEKKD